MSDKLKGVEVIKKAIKLTYQQGECSASQDGDCLYRGECGLKCAVGHLIDDKVYNHNLEHESVGNKAVEYALYRSGVECGDVDEDEFYQALINVQMSHDGCVDYRKGDDFKRGFLSKLEYWSASSGLIGQALKELESEGLFKQ